jgi:hypothetical protein
MATWGEFISEIRVIKVKPGEMYVKVDDVIDLWEERNRLRAEVERLQAEAAGAREACAQELEQFADALEGESEEASFVARALRGVAGIVREGGQGEESAAEEIGSGTEGQGEKSPTAPPTEEKSSGQNAESSGTASAD